MKLTKEQVENRLMRVMDPEVDMDIWSMGLIYEVDIDDDNVVSIVHTLTSPLCPLGPQIQGDIRTELLSLGASRVDIELTFDPPWKAPEGLRDMLGI